MATREEARAVLTKIGLLRGCDMFSMGLIPQKDGGFAVNIILNKEYVFGLPKTLDGIPLNITTVDIVVKEYEQTHSFSKDLT